MKHSLKVISAVLVIALALVAPRAALGATSALPDITTASDATLEEGQNETVEEPVAEIKPSVQYRVYVQSKGWTAFSKNNGMAGTTGQALRFNNFKIKLDRGSLTGSVKYRALRSNGQWTSWKSNGSGVGTYNDIVGFQVKLTGAIAERYDIVYRAHIANVGWQKRVRNGETAGIPGSGLQVEAMRVQLVEKSQRAGWINEGGTWSFYKKGVALKSQWLDTTESPIDQYLVGKHRYWLDSSGVLAIDRYIIPSNARDKKATYTAYATGSGALHVGKRITPVGMTLSDKNGKLYTKTQWLTTSEFDGTNQRYRLQNVGKYAVVKTGFFKVSGKKYYAYEDSGYLMRSTCKWLKNQWYKANSTGVLTNANNLTSQHIERYVKWAVGIANDDSHGYSQYNRWGPDYDCSSLVCASLLAAGFPDSGATYTGNMKKCLKSIGFKWHTDLKKLKRGDIVLVHHEYGRQHTEIYLGNGKLVGAHIDEEGGIAGKQQGDQTGGEISVGSYYNAPWDGFLRYKS